MVLQHRSRGRSGTFESSLAAGVESVEYGDPHPMEVEEDEEERLGGVVFED